VREQVITPRAGRAGAGAKGRGAVSVQRPNTRKTPRAAQKDSRQKGFEWKSALPYVPAVLKVVLAVSLGLLAYLGYRTAVSASFFKVRTVDVAGATRASREEIRAAVLRLSNAGVWQADLETITKELRELPWVRDAVVTRVLPAGLRVRVTERQPRVIARTSGGRLVWADDDGVSLGTATPSDEDFFIRGLEENGTEQARRGNRERMEVALGLKSDWDGAGLSKRVSELDLNDLRDVRVHLAGADAGTQVVLGGQDYAGRFRQALTKLDEAGRVQNGQCVSYINMTTGHNAIFGLSPCGAGRGRLEEAGAAPEAHEPPRESAPARTTTGAPAKESKKKATVEHRPPGAEEKKAKPQAPPGAATRPRRAVE
jgi:hypothetical protein